jgi:phosphoglucosamine mutase
VSELHLESAGPVPGEATDDRTLRDRYLDELARSSPLRLDGLEVVVDAGWGAAAGLASRLLERLGARVHALHDEPSGDRLGLGVGAVFPKVVADAVVRARAHLGVAFDGDADRALFADAHGTIRDGDDVLYLLGSAFAERGELPHRTVVGTSMTNGGLASALAKRDVRVEHVEAVGDRFLGERMRERGYALGGEPSGHVIATRWLGTGDGLSSALMVLREVRHSGASLEELCRGFERFPQLLESEPAPPAKPPLDRLELFRSLLEAKTRELETLGGRLVVRYSGTEPLLRIMAEGPATADLAGIVRALREAYRRSVGGAS